jgi:hypothetical protein
MRTAFMGYAKDLKLKNKNKVKYEDAHHKNELSVV